MTTPVELHPLLLSSSATGYQIERSLRFNSADSAYLSRTLGTTTSSTTFTVSMWVKRTKLSYDFGYWLVGGTTSNSLYGGNQSTNADDIGISAYAAGVNRSASYLMRDPSAWYHLVFAINVSLSGSNKARIYVNGVEVTQTTSSISITTTNFTNGQTFYIGRDWSSLYFDGNIAELYIIDGQQLTPSSFGETDSATGVWKPKAYTGTYGLQGGYYNFSDNSGTTSTTLGKDYSGNGNNLTPNNFSVTAGAGNDSLVDTPTSYETDTGVGGEVRGNYATLNPLAAPTGFSITASNGNLNVIFGNSTYAKSIGSTFGFSSGKWYFEATVNTGATVSFIGIEPINSVIFSDTVSASRVIGYSSTGYGYYSSGDKRNNNTDSSYGTSYTTNDVIGVAVDMDNGKIWFSKNGTWQASGDPAAGTNAAFTSIPANTYIPGVSAYNSQGWILNFGQRPFAYTAPSGFKALCTQNLPTPTIGATSTTQANDYFDVNIYTGNGSSQSITNSGSMKPDFVWVKSRSSTTYHQLYDAVRGVSKPLFSNDTLAEGNYSPYGVTAFNSNGFTVNDITSSGYGVNENAVSYVGWQWRASNTTAVTNNDGTITSTVSASITSGFSIVTYTGTGSSPQSIGHGLGATPAMIILKSRSATSDWYVNHVSIGTNDLRLNLTNTSATNNFFSAKSSTTFTINFNQTGDWVAYCFAPVAGYSAFGSYTGNGSTDGPFVYLGFRPRWIIIKDVTTAYSWNIVDTARDPYNVTGLILSANSADSENNYSPWFDINSNGFKVRSSLVGANKNGDTFIYAAFAEIPFKYSLAR